MFRVPPQAPAVTGEYRSLVEHPSLSVCDCGRSVGVRRPRFSQQKLALAGEIEVLSLSPFRRCSLCLQSHASYLTHADTHAHTHTHRFVSLPLPRSLSCPAHTFSVLICVFTPLYPYCMYPINLHLPTHANMPPYMQTHTARPPLCMYSHSGGVRPY